MTVQHGLLPGISLSLSWIALCCLTACGGGSAATTTTPPTNNPAATKYVAVYDANCRVMIFDEPLSTNMNASVELGQADFTHGCSFNGLNGQNELGSTAFGQGVVFDSSGNLYVADTANNRVLQFAPPFSNSMNASMVIGQSNFTTFAFSSSTNGLTYPYGLAFDASGDLWVTDGGNGRVLEYKPPFSSGMAASIAIGATSTGVAGPHCSGAAFGAMNNTLCTPSYLTFDSAGDLWLVDSEYNRVLEFAPPFSTGMAATLELGHAAGATAFTASQSNDGGSVSASGFYFPSAVQFDSHGNLWVTDSVNNRILEFVSPFSNGMAATLVLGESNFTNHSVPLGACPAVSQASFCTPIGAVFDTSGNLLVTDQVNNRLMIFAPPFSNGMNAAMVIGNGNFTTQGSMTASQSTLSGPQGVATF